MRGAPKIRNNLETLYTRNIKIRRNRVKYDTENNYVRAIKQFSDFCDKYKIDMFKLPLDTQIMALYMQYRVETRSIAQINPVVSGINFYHRIMGYKPNYKNSVIWEDTIKGLRRLYGKNEDSRVPINMYDQIRIASYYKVKLDKNNSIKWFNMVIVLISQVLFSTGLRGCNIFGLIWKDIEFNVKGLKINEGLTEPFVKIKVQNSKTDKNVNSFSYHYIGDSYDILINSYRLWRLYYIRRIIFSKQNKLEKSNKEKVNG